MKVVFIVLSFVLAGISHAQRIASKSDSLLIGTWKGTSICQVKSSPCHDEIAVYHITRSEKPNTYHMLMDKVVNDVEEEMGTLDYDFDAAKEILSYRDNQRNTTWTFKVSSRQMDGTLVYNNQLYRVIKLTKADNK